MLSLPFQAEKRTRTYEWSPTRLIATTVTIDPQERYLSELGGLVFPCNEAAFEAMLDGVAERGGGGLTSAE